MNTAATLSLSSELNAGIVAKSTKTRKISHENRRFFYTIGAFNFLLEESTKVENLYSFKITHIPHAPEWCAGIVSIRGMIMPVVNMHVFLKTGIDTASQKNKLMLLEHNNHPPVVFVIDKLPEVIFIDNYTYGEVPDKSPRWLNKPLKNEANTIYEVDHSILLMQLRNTQL